MPSYATISDLIARYGERQLIELSDRAEPPANVVDTLVVDAALNDAGSTIDSYVSARYRLPLSPIPSVLTRHACAIAWFILQRERYTEEARTAHDDAIAFLKALSNGSARLDVGGTEPPSSAAIAQVDQSLRIFNRDRLSGY